MTHAPLQQLATRLTVSAPWHSQRHPRMPGPVRPGPAWPEWPGPLVSPSLVTGRLCLFSPVVSPHRGDHIRTDSAPDLEIFTRFSVPSPLPGIAVMCDTDNKQHHIGLEVSGWPTRDHTAPSLASFVLHVVLAWVIMSKNYNNTWKLQSWGKIEVRLQNSFYSPQCAPKQPNRPY